MRRAIARLLFLLALLGSLPGRVSASAAEESHQKKLLELFQSAEDVLLTINSEIRRYAERIDSLGQEIRAQGEPAQGRPLPPAMVKDLRELNQIRKALGLIRQGLETKYTRLKGYQDSLQATYPEYLKDVDHFYGLFDRVVEDSMRRHDIAQERIAGLQSWFRGGPADQPDPGARVTRPLIGNPLRPSN